MVDPNTVGEQPRTALAQRMRHAGMAETKLARAAGVDAKTVQRWLSGATAPQARNARAVADALACEPQDLWPDLFPVLDPPSAGTVAISVYASRAQVPVQVWRDHFAKAVEQIDVCVYGGTFLFDSVPAFPNLLLRAADQGVGVRFLVGDPDSVNVARRGEEEAIGDSLPARCRLTLARLQPLATTPGIEIRTHHSTLYASLFRADAVLIANHHIYGSPASDNPALVIDRDTSPDMWASYASSFETMWHTAHPVTP